MPGLRREREPRSTGPASSGDDSLIDEPRDGARQGRLAGSGLHGESLDQFGLRNRIVELQQAIDDRFLERRDIAEFDDRMLGSAFIHHMQ